MENNCHGLTCNIQHFAGGTEEKCGPGQLSRYSDSVETGWSGDGIPVKAKFSAPFEAGPAAHPASSLFTGVKTAGAWH